MKILHLIIDHQVVERTLALFEEVFPDSNDILIFSDKAEYKHLHEHKSCVRISRKDVHKKGKTYDFNGVDYIIAHYLTLEMIDFIGYAPKEIHVSWEIYGFDLYNQFLATQGYNLQYVSWIDYKPFWVRVAYKLSLVKILFFVRYGKITQFDYIRKRYFKKVVKRLDSVSGSKCNAKVLEYYSGKRFSFYETFCYSLEETLGDLYGIGFKDNRNVLIGNSCSLTNNHLYVLDYIKDYDMGDAQIIMPLSYGGYPLYKDDVIAKYSLYFPNNFMCLLDYMPIYEYNKLFLSISVMVMASWREESFGTIIMGLYLGVKIIMSNKSPIYLSLKDEGFHVFEIETITNEDFLCPLTVNNKAYNRNLLLKNYNRDKFVKILKQQFI